MLVREAIMRFFENRDIEFLFHLPGIHTLSLDDTLNRSNIRVILGRHESNSGFMAEGFSEVTGKAGVLLVTPGPGIGNCVSPCMEAYGDDIPLLILFVDVKRNEMKRGLLHGVEAPESLFSGITKGTFAIVRAEELLPTLERAYTLAVAPRQGPVVVSVAYDLLERDLSEDRVETASLPESEDRREAVFDASSIERALKGKERPVILAGTALMKSGLGGLVETLIGRCRIPLFTTIGGKGVVPEDRDWVFGDATAKGVAREIFAAADSVLAIGTRLRKTDTKSRGLKLHDLIHVDVDERWLGQNYHADVALSGELTEAMEAICAALGDRQSAWDIEPMKRARERESIEMERVHPGVRIVQLLRRVIPQDALTVWDPTLLGYWAERWFPVFHGRSFLSPQGVSPIFYALPAAIGAKLGRPDRPCLCVTGDGSILPVIAELATVVAHTIPVVILLYNNGSFGVLEDAMRRRYGAGDSMKLANPDFVSLARSFGIKAERAESPDRLEEIFRSEVGWDEPFLLEFSFPLLPPPW